MSKLSNWLKDSIDQWTSYRVRLTTPHSAKTSLIDSSPETTCWLSTPLGGCRTTWKNSSATLSQWWPTVRPRCASFLQLGGGWEKSTKWPESWYGRVDFVVKYPRRGISISDHDLDHSLGLLQPCETCNSQKFGQLFCAWKLKLKEKLAKYGISSKTNSSSWLRKFSILAQDGCFRPSAGFSRLRNQYVTWIKIQEKMVDLGEKMKTHVSKISLGSWARN